MVKNKNWILKGYLQFFVKSKTLQGWEGRVTQMFKLKSLSEQQTYCKFAIDVNNVGGVSKKKKKKTEMQI